MARPSKTLKDYQALAKQYDLTFTGRISPRYVSESTTWQCLKCGRPLQKSYNNIKFKKSVCPCRWQTLTVEDYEQLGEKLGLFWCGSLLPINTKADTSWIGKGITFRASYNELAYGKIPTRLKEFVP